MSEEISPAKMQTPIIVEVRDTTAQATRKKREAIRKDLEDFDSPAQVLLLAATFAGGITFSVVLAPRDGELTMYLRELAYAGSLFIGGIIGCILIIVAIRVDRTLEEITAAAGAVGVTLFVAFYLLLHATSLYLGESGPFILGSVLYLLFGLLTLGVFLREYYLHPSGRWAAEEGVSKEEVKEIRKEIRKPARR